MTVFEDTTELWQNARDHDDVPTVTGPTSIETLLKARNRFEQRSNDARDGCLVISIETAREIPRGWIQRESSLGHSFEEFDPLGADGVVTVTVGGARVGFLCRPDAIRLDMAILDPDGIVAIAFEGGEGDG